MAGSNFEIERPDGPERGLQITCPEHGEREEFQPGKTGGTFYCSGCGVEIEVQVRAPDWRDWGERC